MVTIYMWMQQFLRSVLFMGNTIILYIDTDTA